MIRNSTGSDCKAVYDLICGMEQKQLPYHAFEAIYLRQLARADFCCLVAEEDGAVIAMLNLRFEEQLHHCETIAEIMEFAVAENCRNKGLGAQMMAAACETALQAGCSQMEVACNQLRTDTHRFYLREGMHNFHFRFSKRLSGEDSAENAFGR